MTLSNLHRQLELPFSPEEEAQLAECERTIEGGLKTFVRVGDALLTIREKRLFREYTTFDAYCQDRWEMSSRQARRLIEAAEVAHNLTLTGLVPENAAQARALSSLPPDQQREVWEAALDTALEGKLTTAHVQETVKRYAGKTDDPALVSTIICLPADLHAQLVAEAKREGLTQSEIVRCALQRYFSNPYREGSHPWPR